MIDAPTTKRSITMDSIEKIDRYATWKNLVAEQEKSGLSQIEFCKSRNLTTSKFGYYRSVIKSQEKVITNKKLFSAVQIKPTEQPKTCEIKIILPNGFQCVMPSTINATHVKQLIEALLSC